MLLHAEVQIGAIVSDIVGVIPAAAAGGRAHARNSRHVPARSA